MKAANGCEKEYYRTSTNAPIVKEFSKLGDAIEYLATKYNVSMDFEERADFMIKTAANIVDDANCDAIYFPDGSVILYELQ